MYNHLCRGAFTSPSVLVHCCASSGVVKLWCPGPCCRSEQPSGSTLQVHLTPFGLKIRLVRGKMQRLLGVASVSGLQNIFLGNMRKKCMESVSVAS